MSATPDPEPAVATSHWRRVARLPAPLLLAVIAAPFATPAAAQPMLGDIGNAPATGISTIGAGARQQIEQLLAPPNATPGAAGANTGPAWKFTPSIEIDQEWTNNAGMGIGAASYSQNDPAFISVVTPSLLVSGESPRISGTLMYAPTINVIEGSSMGNQTEVFQNLNGQAQITLIPETAFVSVSAFGSQQSLYGNTGPTGSSVMNNQNSLQTYSFSVSPYMTRSFGDIGTAEIGATMGETIQNTYTPVVASPYGAANDNVTNFGEHIGFTTGSVLGRSLLSFLVSGNQYQGPFALVGAYDNAATIDGSYGVTRTIALLGRIGYESMHYAGVQPYATTGEPPYNFDGPIWHVGVHWQPSPESTATITFGSKEGHAVVEGNANLALGARTILFASASGGVSSAAQDLQGALQNAELDPFGNAVDRTTGAPLQLTNNAIPPIGLGVIYYETMQSAGIATNFERDTISLNLSHVVTQGLGGFTGQVGGFANAQNSESFSGGLNWSHQISETLSLSTFGQVGRTISQFGTGGGLASTALANQTTSFATIGFNINKTLSETLSAFFRASYTDNIESGATYGQAYLPPLSMALVLVGVRKSF